MSDDAERMSTVDEVAQYLKVPIATLYRWRALGTGPPSIRIGKHIRYRMGDVRDWVQTRYVEEDTERAAVGSEGGVPRSGAQR